MKKLVYLLILFFAFSMSVNAEIDCISEERNNINNKVKVMNVDYDLYASSELFFISETETKSYLVKNINAVYDKSSDSFIISIKRSELNKLFLNNGDSVFHKIRINFDIQNIKTANYVLVQDDKNKDNYNVVFLNSDRNYFSINESYFLLITQSTQKIEISKFYIFGNDSYKEVLESFNNGKTYYSSKELEEKIPLFFGGTTIYFQIIEDEKIDYGNVLYSVSSNKEKISLSNYDNYYLSEEEDFYSLVNYDLNWVGRNITFDKKVVLNYPLKDSQIALIKDYSEYKVFSLSTTTTNHFNGNVKLSFKVNNDKFPGYLFDLYKIDNNKNKLVKLNDSVIKSSDGYSNIIMNSGGKYLLLTKDTEPNPGALLTESINPDDFPKPINFYIVFFVLVFIIMILTLSVKVIKERKKNK